MVQKRDGSLRLFINYRVLKNITLWNRYPIPNIDDLPDQLKGEKYFSKLEFKSRYHQVPIELSEVWKTAVKSRESLFEWLFMPFRLINPLATFIRLVDDILHPFTN